MFFIFLLFFFSDTLWCLLLLLVWGEFQGLVVCDWVSSLSKLSGWVRWVVFFFFVFFLIVLVVCFCYYSNRSHSSYGGRAYPIFVGEHHITGRHNWAQPQRLLCELICTIK